MNGFSEAISKGDMGQYFTPREIVEIHGQDGSDCTMKTMTLDPACGSGGFLLHAMDDIREQAD